MKLDRFKEKLSLGTRVKVEKVRNLDGICTEGHPCVGLRGEVVEKITDEYLHFDWGLRLETGGYLLISREDVKVIE